jgi:molybdopterin converting factor small subunit
MRVTVRLFARLRDYERTMSVAVNADYSKMSAAVKDGDEVAFLPPVSGG